MSLEEKEKNSKKKTTTKNEPDEKIAGCMMLQKHMTLVFECCICFFFHAFLVAIENSL